MPSAKKKIDYESQGFVRRLMKKGASFRSLNGGEPLSDSFNSSSFGRFKTSEGNKWRPQKNQFELLDGDDDDDSLSAAFQSDNTSWNIENTISSTHSETGEYRGGIVFEQKSTVLKKTPVKNRCTNRKRELSPIKPPCKDTSAINPPTSSAKKAPQKKNRQDIQWGGDSRQVDLDFLRSNTAATSDDPFFGPTTDSFGFETHEKNNNAKMPSTISRHMEESNRSRQTNLHSSYNSVVSDPTDFFSKEQTTNLTMNNLTKMESTFNSTTAKKNATPDGMKKLVKERKFYQFAVDEDRASTVVESTLQLPADYPGGDYSIDDDTSCGETSQGTRIQQRSIASETLPQPKKQSTEHDSDFISKNTTNTKIISTSEMAYGTLLTTSSHSRNHAEEVKEYDTFFPSDINTESNQGKNFDSLFPSTMDKDGFFPDFGGAKETQNAPPAPETDISSSGGDAYFDPRHMLRGRHANRNLLASTKTLSYSISPVHREKNAVVPQNGRQPLTLKTSQPNSGKKNNPFPVNSVLKKPDQGNEWFASENVRESEAQFQFDEFAPRPSSSKKRHSSISSSNFQPPPADPFESSPQKVCAKENFDVKSNRHEDLDGNWGTNQNKHHRSNLKSQDRPLQKILSYDESDTDEEDDIFDDVGQWERPAPTSIGRGVMAPQNRSPRISRARLTRQSPESFNRPSRNQYIDDYDDDARSASGFSVEKAPRGVSTGSRVKPLAMPSNAIMASMLFQTQHDIDQNDVEEKINAYEQENSRQSKIRDSQGGIPDAVNTDDDYMTTVSSFSECTSAYLQETWRKPSRDLLNHFTSARALDMEYRSLPVRTSRVGQQEQGLFEA